MDDQLFFLLFAIALVLVTAGVSWIFSFVSARLARNVGAIDRPTGGRKIHTRPIALWGGLGIMAAIVLIVVPLHFGNYSIFTLRAVNAIQVTGFLCALLILLIGGLIDDRYSIPPWTQFLFPFVAALVVIASGTGIIQVTNPLEHRAFSLVWLQWPFTTPWGTQGLISLPSDLLTLAWLLVATYAMKILDGLDGLVTGMTVIGAGIVGALTLSTAYFQPPVALLTAVIGGAYLGFLPRNMNPAKQFLGESGSTIAGFSLAVLAILSSAKIAVALSVLAIPIADVVLVILGRVKRGVPWFRGDATHLHHKLIQAGLPQRVAVLLYWGIALFAGIAALSLQTKGKIFLILLLCVIAAFTSYVAGLKASRK